MAAMEQHAIGTGIKTITRALRTLGGGANRLGPAQNTALKQCYSNGGKDCVIRAFVCDAKG